MCFRLKNGIPLCRQQWADLFYQLKEISEFGSYFQISGETVGEVQIVKDMHERKAVMAREADAFIALPGRFLSKHLY